jgi:hypothetical protein
LFLLVANPPDKGLKMFNNNFCPQYNSPLGHGASRHATCHGRNIAVVLEISEVAQVVKAFEIQEESPLIAGFSMPHVPRTVCKS